MRAMRKLRMMTSADTSAGPPELVNRRKAQLDELMGRRRSSPSDLRFRIDDMVSRRNNNAQAFFGKSRSLMSQEELEEVLGESAEREAEMERLSQACRPNSILVAGATGETGRLVVLELQKREFNVRVLCRNLKKAEELFGLDGAELDIVVGDIRNAREVEEAAVGCQAGIFCVGSRLPFGSNSFQAVDGDGAINFANAMRSQGCKKAVLISSIGASNPSSRGGFANTLVGDPLGAKKRGEDALRTSGVPYAIVRPGGLRDTLGGVDAIEVGQGDEFSRCGISRMDVAECAVAALISDKENLTFEVKNVPMLQSSVKRPILKSFSEPNPLLVENLRAIEAVESEAFWAQVLAPLTCDA